MNASDISVLVPAAGEGGRLGLGCKALLPLAGRPVLEWVVDRALQLGDEVLAACVPGVQPPAGCGRVEGGATRQQSVLNLVRAASRPWVLVWDCARPFGSLALARAVLAAAQQGGAAAAWLPVEAPVAVRRGDAVELVPAAAAGTVQTPLAFRRELLLAALERAQGEGWQAASTVELAVRAGIDVAFVPGEKLNFKLTTPEDWRVAQGLANLL